MPQPNAAALSFLQTRRSRPAKTLAAPAPDAAALRDLLTIAARTPDHGKLEPWRFIVLTRAALPRFADSARALGEAQGRDPMDIVKAASQFADSPLAVVVVASPKPSPKVPRVEQLLSAGAVCLSLLNGALAAGWGANWLTGWASHDRDFCALMGLSDDETIAGIIHIGSESSAPPERPRPDIDAITTWVEA